MVAVRFLISPGAAYELMQVFPKASRSPGMKLFYTAAAVSAVRRISAVRRSCVIHDLKQEQRT
jgi:hypothetical protein